MAVLISAIDLASFAVVAKLNKLEGAELQLLQATRPPSSLKQRILFFSLDFGWVVNNTFFWCEEFKTHF